MHFAIILAIFEVSNMLTSLGLGLIIGKLQRKNLIFYSNIILLLSTLSFTFLDYVESYWLFFGLSILFRVFQGLASAAIQICAYSFATNEMKQKQD